MKVASIIDNTISINDEFDLDILINEVKDITEEDKDDTIPIKISKPKQSLTKRKKQKAQRIARKIQRNS